MENSWSKQMNSSEYEWNRFHAYRVFDEFLERFIIQRQSYVTDHKNQLDLELAFEDIRARFVAAFDESNARFEDKVNLQFQGASENTKIVFTNVEYLWAMPMENVTPLKKRSYAQRWFSDPDLVVRGEQYFFGYPHIIANPGSWYLRNKYWELIALLRVLSHITKEAELTDLAGVKQKIAGMCHSAIYKGVPPEEEFSVSKKCGVHSALMHLADPESYESIISASHRQRICAVFGHVVEDPSDDAEILLKQIRSTLYDSHGLAEDLDRKYRWFFYSKDVHPLWIDKKSKKAQQVSSAVFDVRLEEEAIDLEGTQEEFTGYRIRRSAKLVRKAKERDNYTCRACNFHFENQIVHVHHLDPISEYNRPRETKLEDLLTLCPTCHYLAHYWLRKSNRFKQLQTLLAKLH